MRWLQESFGAKLLAALFATVGLLLLVTFLVVGAETSRQLEIVEARTIEAANALFAELNDFQQRQAAQLARPFTEGRAAVRVRFLIESGSFEELALDVDYDMQRAGLPEALLVFTDNEGHPVLSMVPGGPVFDADPADVAPLAAMLLDSEQRDATAYRLVGDRLYHMTALLVTDPAMRPVGTITFGLPIAAADVEDVAQIGGFEACFHLDGRCVVQTPGVAANPELEALMDEAAGSAEPMRVTADGDEWSVSSLPLEPDEPSRGERIVAVPLADVAAPFGRIERALLFGGVGALFLSGLLGTALGRSLTRPVKVLVDAARRVADGDYDAEVSVTSRDEMGVLANAFNEMTQGLQKREHYRAVLNKVVSQDVAEELMKGDVELGGESRLVTVLFADIRGFTPLTDGMEPEAVISLLNECMEYLAQAIDAEGGVVDKYIGDEVMAVFGAPVGQEDHARRALAAALRMRVGMATFNMVRQARGEQPLAIGVGINSGVAVAGNMGSTNRMNYTVVGDMVNLASRLAGQAGPGEILISGSTLRLAGSGVEAPPAGERALKGFASGVEVYALASMTRDPGGAGEGGPAADPSEASV